MTGRTAWLVADHRKGDYLCLLYGGHAEDTLVAGGRAATAAAAVSWGLARTEHVRIRTREGHSYWAGTAVKPDGILEHWVDDRESTR